MKLRSDSTLSQFSDEQRDDLYAWLTSGLSYREASEKAVLPAPEGFGVLIHPTTLWRWFPRDRERRQLEALAEAKASAMVPGQAAEVSEIAEAARREFAHALFHHATAPDSLPSFAALSRAFHRLKIEARQKEAHALAQQRLELETRKFEYDAFAAAKHAHALVPILDDDRTTDLEKFALARPIVFGADVAQASSPSQPTSNHAPHATTPQQY